MVDTEPIESQSRPPRPTPTVRAKRKRRARRISEPHRSRAATYARAPRPPSDQRLLRIPSGDATLEADLTLPPSPRGLVVFAHGSGSNRHSHRDQAVANALVDAGFATLLFDLLTERESALDAQTAELRFDRELLARRVVDAIDWTTAHPLLAHLPLWLYGAGMGASAAFLAAAARPGAVGGIISRGGRIEVADETLASVRTPSLLIVGGNDHTVVRRNQRAHAKLAGETELHIVRGATHLFEEPGALDEVARVTTRWLSRRWTDARSTTTMMPTR